jgi:toxin ParE1/3/4
MSSFRRKYDLGTNERYLVRRFAAGLDVQQRIIEAAESLASFPDRGRPWRLRAAKELLVPGLPYVIIYRIARDRVIVLALFHTSRA